MQASWIQTLGFPVITGLILLAIEYFAIQPWLRYRESKFLVSKDVDTGGNGRKWSDGIRNGIRQFKQHANNYNWGGISIKQHFVVIAGFHINKGQAEIFLIVNVRYLLDKQRPVGRYRIVIDRVGDISQLETIALRKNPFDNQQIAFPRSWLAIGFFVILILMIRALSFMPKGFVVMGDSFNGTAVPELRSQAIPIALNSSTNGTIGTIPSPKAE